MEYGKCVRSLTRLKLLVPEAASQVQKEDWYHLFVKIDTSKMPD